MSAALMIVFAILAARRSVWSWTAAGLSNVVGMAPGVFSGPGLSLFQLSPLALVTLLVPTFGWRMWRRSIRSGEPDKVPVRHAGRGSYLIGGSMLLLIGLIVALPFLLQGALSAMPVLQLPLVILSFLTAGLQIVTLLGFAFGLLQSWWLLFFSSALPLLLALLNLFSGAPPAPGGLGQPVNLLLLHLCIVILSITGYRSWRRALTSRQTTERMLQK